MIKNFKTVFILVFLSNALVAPAQTVTGQNHTWCLRFVVNSAESQIGDPEHDSWGYAFPNFNNFSSKKNVSTSFSLVPEIRLKNAVSLRCEIGLTMVRLRSFYDSHSASTDQSHLLAHYTINQDIYRFLPGIQWNFVERQRVSFYCGLNLVSLFYSGMHYTNHTEARALPSDTLISTIDDHATAQGGFGCGAGTFGGFNIRLKDHFSIGVEISTALLYKKLGGTFAGTAVAHDPPNPDSSQDYSFSTSSYEGVEFTRLSPALNFTLWF